MEYAFVPFHREEIKEEWASVPELCDGFDAALPPPPDGMQPVSFMTEKMPEGGYEVSITLRASADTEDIFLFTGRKQLRDIFRLKKGEVYRGTFAQHITEIIPRWHARAMVQERLFFTICTREPESIAPAECRAVPSGDVRTVWLCGDSTVTDQASEIPYHPGACYASWGQALTAYTGDAAAVQNQAHCGLTTESFRKEGHFDIVRRHVRRGDLCLFQFGHNDQKISRLLADRDYPVNLRRYIEETRACGAVPVLVTPPGRNIWSDDGAYLDLLEEHARAARRTAGETAAYMIDLHRYSTEFIRKAGCKAARGYFHPDDYTHTNEYGAYLLASYVARRLKDGFPELFGNIGRAPGLQPPEKLWETLRMGNNRPAGESQREVFDRMEKDTGELLKAIKLAKLADK